MSRKGVDKMADHEKVFVVCENMCLEEGMTKEQIQNTYKVKGDFAVIEGILETGGQGNFNFPDGFNKANSVIISVMLQNIDQENGLWSCGSVFDTSGYQVGAVPFKIYVKNNVEGKGVGTIVLRNLQRTSDNYLTQEQVDSEFSYKIVLMKVS